MESFKLLYNIKRKKSQVGHLRLQRPETEPVDCNNYLFLVFFSFLSLITTKLMLLEMTTYFLLLSSLNLYGRMGPPALCVFLGRKVVISFQEIEIYRRERLKELETNFCKVKRSFRTPPTLCNCLIYTYKDF